MEPTYHVNYRAGWIEPANEYIPEIIQPKPQWTTPSRIPDYGPVVEDDYLPRNPIKQHAYPYQRIQYTEPFHNETPTTDLMNETHHLDPMPSYTSRIKLPPTSTQREPINFEDIYNNQNISQREWQQRKLKGITNMSNLDHFVNQLWDAVNQAVSQIPQTEEEEVLTMLQSKLDSLSAESKRIDPEDLNRLRDLGVKIPQRVNRSKTVRKAVQQHIDKLETSSKKNI